MKLLGKQSFSKGIFSSTILNVMAKGLQFVSTILIAYYFGANRNTDLYYFIIATSLLISALINNLDNVALMPEFIRIKERQGQQNAFKFLNLYIYLYVGIGLLVLLVILLLGNNSIATIFNVSVSTIEANLFYIKMAAFLPLLMLITNLFSAIINAYNFFSIPVIINLINSIAVLVITILFHKSIGAMAGIVALVIGYSINIFLLLYLLSQKIKWNFIGLHFGISKNLKTTIFVSYFTSLPITLRNYMVSFLFNGLGSGVLTAVNWGQQIAGLPDVFITSQVLNITSIKLSEYNAQNQQQKAYDIFKKVFEYLFVILFICMAISILYSNEIITILLSRGSFDAEKSKITIVTFMLLSILPVINLLPMVAGRLFIAFQLLKKTTWVTTFSHIVIISILYFAIKNYGYWGFCIGSIIGYFIQTILYMYLTNITFNGIELLQIFKKIITPILWFTLLTVALFILHHFVDTRAMKIVSMMLGIFSYAGLLFILYRKTAGAFIANFKQ